MVELPPDIFSSAGGWAPHDAHWRVGYRK